MSDGSQGLSTDTTTEKPQGFLRKNRFALIAIGPIAIAAGFGYLYLTGGKTEATDNAYVQVAKAPVSSAVAGRIVDVLVKENQRVEVGQPLFRIDAQDFAVEAAQAEAQVAQAELQVRSMRASYTRTLANVTGMKQTLDYAEREFARQKELLAAGVVAQQKVDEAQHAVENARAALSTAEADAATALANLDGDPNAPIEGQPSVMAAQARLTRAQINQGYTEVKALTAGTVTRVDQLQVGGYVSAAQTVFWLMTGQPWVEANFKEDQLAKMKVGQPAEIKVDACRDQKLAGHVASFSPGTGSTFSALPAQNATGNWVKVTQRLPVQIAFDKTPPENCTRAGLSASVTVNFEVAPATVAASGQ